MLGKILLSLSCFFFLLSCGSKTDDELTDEVVQTANNILSNLNCQEAIDLLENHGRQNFHAAYLQTLASAYACRANFSETVFYADYLPTIGSSSSELFGPLVQFDTSIMTSATDINYEDIQQAIDILLYAGDLNEPSATNRLQRFNDDDANDINNQLLYLVLTQLGKFTFYYGNANPNLGRKANRAASDGNPNLTTNECFLNYTQADAITYIGTGVTGSCDNTNEGAADLDKGSLQLETFVRRACEGVVLFNNFIDIFTNVALSSGTEFGDLNNLITAINTAFTTGCTTLTGGGRICSVKSQSECEASFAVDPGDPNATTGTNLLELYIVAVYETLFI